MKTKTIDLDYQSNVHIRRDAAKLVGRRAAYTTYEGETLVGTLEASERWGTITGLIIRFDDGRWARGDDVIVLVLDERSARPAVRSTRDARLIRAGVVAALANLGCPGWNDTTAMAYRETSRRIIERRRRGRVTVR